MWGAKLQLHTGTARQCPSRLLSPNFTKLTSTGVEGDAAVQRAARIAKACGCAQELREFPLTQNARLCGWPSGPMSQAWCLIEWSRDG